MATKKAAAQQQKEKREKIVLGVLLAVLVVVVIVEVPKFMGSGGTPAAAPATATTAGGASLAVAPAAAPVGAAQLRQFSGFAAKDPFKSQVQLPATGGTAPADGTPPATKPAKLPKTSPVVVKVTPQTAAQVPTGPMVPAALIMLNGKRQVIPLNGTFPEKSPLFRLVGIGPKEISLRLIGGSLSGGQQTFKLRKGHPLRLVNQTAGTHFVLAMLRPTTAPKPAQVITPAATVTAPAAPATTAPILGSPPATTTTG